MWCCRETLRLVASEPRLRFAFRKASATVTLVGHLKCLEVLPPPIPLALPSWSSSCCPVTATPSPPLPTSPAGTLMPHFHRRPSVAIEKPASVMPILVAVTNAVLAHPPGTPQQSLLHPLSHRDIGHRFVPQHHSGAQVHTHTS